MRVGFRVGETAAPLTALFDGATGLLVSGSSGAGIDPPGCLEVDTLLTQSSFGVRDDGVPEPTRLGERGRFGDPGGGKLFLVNFILGAGAEFIRRAGTGLRGRLTFGADWRGGEGDDREVIGAKDPAERL